MLRSTCVALFVFAGIAAADVQSGVVRSGGQPIPGATVTAQCGTDKIPTVTDDAGRFEIGGLPSTSCKYTVLIFGFEPLQKDAAASSTPLTLDLTLQGHASVPVAPGAAPAPVKAPAAPVVTAVPATPAPGAPAAPAAPMPTMAGRGAVMANNGRGAQAAAGGRGAAAAGGRGGQGGGRGGFQSLSLTTNGDVLASDAPASVLGGDTGGGAGAGDAFTINGTVSSGVQAQPGDGFGGGPGGFGFGAGGPGGIGGDFGGQGGPGGRGGDKGGGGGRGGGQGGPGGGGGPPPGVMPGRGRMPFGPGGPMGGGPPPMGGGPPGPMGMGNSEIMAWVREHGELVDSKLWQHEDNSPEADGPPRGFGPMGGARRLYDLRPSAGLVTVSRPIKESDQP